MFVPQRLRAGGGAPAGGSYYSQPAPGAAGDGEGVKSFFKFLLVVLAVAVVLGGVGHAKKNNLGPFAPSRNMKKSDGALGGSWETDTAFDGGGMGGMSSLYDGGGGGMGGGAYMAPPAQAAWSSPAPMGAADGPGFAAPPSAAEARAALSRRR